MAEPIKTAQYLFSSIDVMMDITLLNLNDIKYAIQLWQYSDKEPVRRFGIVIGETNKDKSLCSKIDAFYYLTEKAAPTDYNKFLSVWVPNPTLKPIKLDNGKALKEKLLEIGKESYLALFVKFEGEITRGYSIIIKKDGVIPSDRLYYLTLDACVSDWVKLQELWKPFTYI